jgi:DNA-binding response OmpR family regulator
MGTRVLVVDDDADIGELVAFHLRRAGMEPLLAASGREGLDVLQRDRPDIVVLDIMLPDASGWDVCRHIHEHAQELGDPAVILLTALGEEADRVSGLEMGADDYVTKPFSPRELVARVRAVLRRRGPVALPGPEVERLGPISVDRHRVVAAAHGHPLSLTATEFRILAALVAAGGQVLSREQLLDAVWGADFFGDRRTVDVHIRHIRSKLEAVGAGDALETVRGFGYRLRRGGGEDG